jgi:hypothetical protein
VCSLLQEYSAGDFHDEGRAALREIVAVSMHHQNDWSLAMAVFFLNLTIHVQGETEFQPGCHTLRDTASSHMVEDPCLLSPPCCLHLRAVIVSTVACAEGAGPHRCGWYWAVPAVADEGQGRDFQILTRGDPVCEAPGELRLCDRSSNSVTDSVSGGVTAVDGWLLAE